MLKVANHGSFVLLSFYVAVRKKKQKTNQKNRALRTLVCIHSDFCRVLSLRRII